VRRPGARLSLAWVRLYTHGAAPAAGSRRVREIASDIWEQEHDASAGRRPVAVDLTILVRCLRGVPADLSWRFHHRPTGGSTLMQTIVRNALVLTSALLAAWFFFLGVAIRFDDSSPSAWWSLWLLASGVAVLAGIRWMQHSPWLGCAVLIVGAMPNAAVTYWAVFPLVLALIAVVLAVVRARELTRRPVAPAPA